MLTLQRIGWTSLLAIAFLLSVSSAVVAGPYDGAPDVSIRVDESGNGSLTNAAGIVFNLPSGRQNDPGPGGLAGVLTFSLLNPPALTAGDVLIQDGIGGPILDVVRFNPNEICVDGSRGCLVFYSDNVDGLDNLADTPSPPLALYANTALATEIGPQGNNAADYPAVGFLLPGQPGFVDAVNPVHYLLISDVSVPEPASLAILGVGLAGLGLARSRRRRKLS